MKRKYLLAVGALTLSATLAFSSPDIIQASGKADVASEVGTTSEDVENLEKTTTGTDSAAMQTAEQSGEGIISVNGGTAVAAAPVDTAAGSVLTPVAVNADGVEEAVDTTSETGAKVNSQTGDPSSSDRSGQTDPTDGSDGSADAEEPGTGEGTKGQKTDDSTGDSAGEASGDSGEDSGNQSTGGGDENTNPANGSGSDTQDPNPANESGSETPDASEGTDAGDVTGSSVQPAAGGTEQRDQNEQKAQENGTVKASSETEETGTEEEPAVIRRASGSRVVTTPEKIEDYHFWTVGKRYVFAVKDCNILEDREDNARAVGVIREKGVMYLLKQVDEDWLYVESGNVRGFIRTVNVVKDEAAGKVRDEYYRNADLENDEQKAAFDWTPYMAVPSIDYRENSAYAYFRATTDQTVVQKAYAIAGDLGVTIYEETDGNSTIVGHMNAGDLGYVISDLNNGWLFIESGDARGFAAKSLFTLGTDADKAVKEKGESFYTQAEMLLKPEQNKACYYTKLSYKSGRPDGLIGESLVEYASSYIGNPYIWGGTSLTDGADCSGFVQSIYQQYGIELPRVAEDQAMAGTAISLDYAEPGDLVFYRDENGYIYHVAIYAGEGKTVEAYSPTEGIISGTVNVDAVCWCVRILPEDDIPNIVNNGDSVVISANGTIGGAYTYERWDRTWAAGTRQKALNAKYEGYDAEGFGRIGDRYVIACTTTFGQVGDLIDFVLADGTVIKTVVGDIKNQSDPGCTIWGHMNGENVIEFIVDGSSWYKGHANPGAASCHPDWGGLTVTQAVNYGNILG